MEHKYSPSITMGAKIYAIALRVVASCSGLLVVGDVSGDFAPVPAGPIDDCTIMSKVYLGPSGTIAAQK